MKQFLRFELIEEPEGCRRKTRMINVFSNHSNVYLGRIKWENGWRQYVFHPYEQTIWSTGCLKQLSDYIKEWNENHKEKVRS